MEIPVLNSYNKGLAVLSGLIVGILFISASNLAGVNPVEYITVYNTDFITQTVLASVLMSTTLLFVSLLSSGIVTSFMLAKKNCIYGGFAGISLIVITMMFAYPMGGISFPIFSQFQSLIGVATVPLVFLAYVIPLTMIGFVLGFLGSYMAENFSYIHPSNVK
ncbi:MAG: hypothetical protein NKF70_13905 [Methanobacterium sp. ERen5]|nr:MAG: hypothetical protein NKF70_13905 [Methanobacterium sp. ERen5]